MSKLTDTQLVIFAAASQRDDRGVELPANIRGEAARKVVDKLIRADLLEEVRAGGSLPVWRRDDGSGPMALRITKNGLEAIDVEDETTAGSKEPSVRHSHNSEVENSAPNAIASRKRISVATQKSTRKKHHPGQGQNQSRLAARQSAWLETGSRARDAGPTGGSDNSSHHPRDPLAAALRPRLLRSCCPQTAPPPSPPPQTRPSPLTP